MTPPLDLDAIEAGARRERNTITVELCERLRELGALLARETEARKSYEEGITWETTCLHCASMLSACYAETMRADAAEAIIAGDWRPRPTPAEFKAHHAAHARGGKSRWVTIYPDAAHTHDAYVVAFFDHNDDIHVDATPGALWSPRDVRIMPVAWPLAEPAK